ncbi:hypothetical protein Aoki45_40140 [Algoriphagus sp. oki45]|nr:hypothetical protein Aoki45_40140 [Algoriphagus sp. oki45]
MKKLSLEMLRLSTNEILERSQMKKITGGYGTCTTCTRYDSNLQPNGTYTTSGSCNAGPTCYNDPDCFTWSCS